MLPEINLLPKKEKKNRSGLYAMIILLVATLLIVGGFGYWMWSLQQEQADLEQDLQQYQQQNAALQDEIEGDETEKQMEQVEQLATQLDEAIVTMESIMQTTAGNVPNNGNLMTFTEQEGVIELTVQTETNEEAVEYYQDLSEVESIHDVMIRTIDYVESEEYYLSNYTVNLQAEEEGDQNETE